MTDSLQDIYRKYARDAALSRGVDPAVFERLINQESGFRHVTATGQVLTSSSGAQGIAQIMPFDAARKAAILDPFDSLDWAAQHLKDALVHFGGDYTKSVAAYNAGSGAVDQYGGVPPFPETQRYVAAILGGGAPSGASGASGASGSSGASAAGGGGGGGALATPVSAPSGPPPGCGELNPFQWVQVLANTGPGTKYSRGEVSASDVAKQLGLDPQCLKYRIGAVLEDKGNPINNAQNVPILGGIAQAITGGGAASWHDALDTIGKFLTDKANWWRIGLVGAGAVLFAAGSRVYLGGLRDKPAQVVED